MATKPGFVIVRGVYDDQQNLKVFTDKAKAEQWARDYNADNPWSTEDDKARVEEIEIDS
jgi:hypothetical protein